MKKILLGIISMILGGLIGFLTFFVYENIINLFVLIISIIIGVIFSIFIHEFGHLVFGKLTGYKFNSFRFLTVFIYKNCDDKIKFKFDKIPAGILGQCLLYYDNEEKIKDNSIPYKLYNYGGNIFNFIFICIFTCLVILFFENKTMVVFIAPLAIINTFFFVNNFFDFGKDVVNDGRNIKSINKYPHMGKKLLIEQLNQVYRLSKNITYKDLNIVEIDQSMDYLINISFSYSNYLLLYFKYLDENNFEKGEELLEKMIELKEGLAQSVYFSIFILYFSHLVIIKKDYVKAKTLFINQAKKYKKAVRIETNELMCLYCLAYSILTKKYYKTIEATLAKFEKINDKQDYLADRVKNNLYIHKIRQEISENAALYQFDNKGLKAVFVEINALSNKTCELNFGFTLEKKLKNKEYQECLVINQKEEMDYYIGYLVAKIKTQKKNKSTWVISNENVSKEEISSKIHSIEKYFKTELVLEKKNKKNF